LEVVVGGVGERAFPVAVAQGPDAGHPGLEPIVHDDVAALVTGHASSLEPEIVRVRLPAHGEQQMRARDRRTAGLAIDMSGNIARLPADLNAFRIQSNVDAFAGEDVL